jgi:hypothetical protein
MAKLSGGMSSAPEVGKDMVGAAPATIVRNWDPGFDRWVWFANERG